jgi:hypothetical protein
MAILNVFKLRFKGDNGCRLMEEGWGLQIRRTRRPGARAWQWHWKNGRWQWQSLQEEDEEGGFLEIRFRSRDTCSIGGVGVLGWQGSWAVHCDYATGAMNESGEVGRPSRKGRGGPGQAGRLGRN